MEKTHRQLSDEPDHCPEQRIGPTVAGRGGTDPYQSKQMIGKPGIILRLLGNLRKLDKNSRQTMRDRDEKSKRPISAQR
jgi:hypothetical protein